MAGSFLAIGLQHWRKRSRKFGRRALLNNGSRQLTFWDWNCAADGSLASGRKNFGCARIRLEGVFLSDRRDAGLPRKLFCAS